jgi:hypothetical protein
VNIWWISVFIVSYVPPAPTSSLTLHHKLKRPFTIWWLGLRHSGKLRFDVDLSS